VDRKLEVCYVERYSFFQTKDYGTIHRKMMHDLGRWQEYEAWKKRPRKHLRNLESYAGFVRVKGEWQPKSCTLNAAHSGLDLELVLDAIKESGNPGMDERAKAEGMDIMKETIWLDLKQQLDDITREISHSRWP